MAFDWQYKHFPTVAAFAAYLDTLAPPAWAAGLTLHHTWKPTVSDWRGGRSMAALERYYRTQVVNPDGSKGWPAAPHLFIGPDGIHQGTPINHRGVHAGPCNATRIAIEVVGDYDQAGWQDPITGFVYGCLVALLRWLGKDQRAINGHRDCMPGTKTCPGDAIDLPTVRSQVARLLAAPAADATVIGVPPSISLAQFRRAILRNGEPLNIVETERIYTLCSWLDIDPAFLLALWLREGGRPLGSSDLQRRSNGPINIKAPEAEWRPTVWHNGEKWRAYESWQLGLIAAIEHLKTVYGWQLRAHTVRSIVTALAPASDGNDVERYIASILEDMAYMRSH